MPVTRASGAANSSSNGWHRQTGTSAFSAGRLDTKYRRLNQPAQDSGVRLDNELANSPAWSVAAGTAYRLDLGSLGELTARLDWSWQDAEYHDAVNSPQIRQPAFHLVNASLAFVPRDDRWQLTVATRNLLDETYLVTRQLRIRHGGSLRRAGLWASARIPCLATLRILNEILPMPSKSRNTLSTEGAAKPANIWLLGMRPRTLTMAAVPVTVGAVLAWAGDAVPAWITFIVTLGCALLIQIGTNLFNDANDGERGADGPDRIGRMTNNGRWPGTAEAGAPRCDRLLRRGAFGGCLPGRRRRYADPRDRARVAELPAMPTPRVRGRCPMGRSARFT